MKTIVSQICILLLFSICSIPLLKAQDLDCDKFPKSEHDVAVLLQILSHGGTYNASWSCDSPNRIRDLSVSDMSGSLDVSGCTGLASLSCSNSQITSINVSGCTALLILNCPNNSIKSIDLKGCNTLYYLICSSNQLNNLDVSVCPFLNELDCRNNPLTSLNASDCSYLYEINFANNYLEYLDLSGCSSIKILPDFGTLLTSLKLRNCTALRSLICNNKNLKSIDVSGCSSLLGIECYRNQLNNLNLEGCIALEAIKCYTNQLEKLDISSCKSLKTLNCAGNKLSSLNLSNCPSLTDLDCRYNMLTNLKATGCASLNKLYISDNYLSDANLISLYGLNLGCNIEWWDSYRLDLSNNLCFSEQAIRNLTENLPCLTYNQIHWDPCTNSNPFSFKNNWTVSKIPGMSEHPIGVVADGSSAIKINLTQNDKSITVKRVDITLTDINGYYIPVGQIGTSVSKATQIDLYFKNYLPDSIFYVAPDLVNYDNHYNYDWNRKVVVQIIINNNSDNGYALYDTIDIIRPPVLLIHGLNSDYKCFSQLQTELFDSDRYKTGQAYCVDYSPTNQAFFEENSHVLPNSIKGIKRDWKEKGYAVSKVDVVGHSMGGILSRLYLQSSYYDNDIHKLITVNTPHAGSQGANILASLPAYVRFGLEGNAVNDLCVTSFAIRTLLNGNSVINKNTVPSHAIITKTSSFSSAVRNNKLGSAIYLAFSLYQPALSVGIDFIPPLVYKGESDLVVAVNSQEGGLSSSTLVQNEWHCGSPDNPIVKSKISELLMLPSTDTAFSMQGFDPPTLNPPAFNILENMNNNIPTKSKVFANKKDSVYFILPTNSITAKSGDLITIEVAKTANVKNLIFMAMESKDSVYLKDTTATSMSFIYHIPSTNIGNIPMYVFGADTLGNIYADSVFVNTTPNATVQSLEITYPNNPLLKISQGLKSAVQVSCLFSDNIKREITTLPDVQYSTKTGNAVIVSKGIIKGMHEGLDTLTVSYASLSCSLPISVNQDYICTVNASVNPNNSGIITKGPGTYFYSDSVKVVAIPQLGYEFDFWSENGVKVSTNINYSFEIYESQNLVANFISSTGVKNISIDSNDLISMYPNPNDGNFTVDISADYCGEVVINIFSVTGVQCDHIEFAKYSEKIAHEIHSRYLEKGIYFVKIFLGHDIVTKKIIIN